MVLVVPFVGPSALGVCFRTIFIWFLYRFNRPPSLVHLLSESFSYGFPMVLYSVRMVLVVPLVGPSALGVRFRIVFILCSYGVNRSRRWVARFGGSCSYGVPTVL